MQAKIGRPKLDITRTVLIGARFTPEEAREIEQAVAGAGKVKSDWIRELLLAAARSGAAAPLPPPAPSVPFAQPDSEFLD